MAKTFNPFSVTIGVASGQIIGADNRRKVIVLCSHATARYSVNLQNAAVLDAGITIQPLSPPVVLTHDVYGDQIQSVVNAIAATAATTVGAVTVTDS